MVAYRIYGRLACRLVWGHKTKQRKLYEQESASFPNHRIFHILSCHKNLSKSSTRYKFILYQPCSKISPSWEEHCVALASLGRCLLDSESGILPSQGFGLHALAARQKWLLLSARSHHRVLRFPVVAGFEPAACLVGKCSTKSDVCLRRCGRRETIAHKTCVMQQVAARVSLPSASIPQIRPQSHQPVVVALSLATIPQIL